MSEQQGIRFVLDTNVVFEGLTKQDGVCGALVNVWFHGLIEVCVTDALVYEYIDVLSRKLSPARQRGAEVTLAVLLSTATLVTVYYSWRPSSPDPGDELVIDCVMNANAILVTSNVRDFRQAQRALGLQVMTPLECLKFLSKQSGQREVNNGKINSSTT